LKDGHPKHHLSLGVKGIALLKVLRVHFSKTVNYTLFMYSKVNAG
jgi:hypothetical protein